MRNLLNHMKVKHNYPSDPLVSLNDSGVLAATAGQPTYLHEAQMLLSRYSNAITFLASLTSILTAGMPPPANLLWFGYTLQSSTILRIQQPLIQQSFSSTILQFNNPSVQQSFDSSIVGLKSFLLNNPCIQ